MSTIILSSILSKADSIFGPIGAQLDNAIFS